MTARKTLSMKRPYGSFWAAQPNVNEIESNLNKTVMQIMEEYKGSHIYFNEQHRNMKIAVLDKRLQECLRISRAEIDKEKKPPQLKEDLFKQITARVKENLKEEEVEKFDAALNALISPQPALPIVKV